MQINRQASINFVNLYVKLYVCYNITFLKSRFVNRNSLTSQIESECFNPRTEGAAVSVAVFSVQGRARALERGKRYRNILFSMTLYNSWQIYEIFQVLHELARFRLHSTIAFEWGDTRYRSNTLSIGRSALVMVQFYYGDETRWKSISLTEFNKTAKV